jgi:response regulator RpfG family c-di-GMP phosphodiesterase
MIDTSKTTVLTVEDDDFVREVIVLYLEDCGFNVLQAVNGRQGIEIFRNGNPDLVLLDLRMPEVDGLEVLATVTSESPELPVIVVSGMGTIGDAIKALKLGAWDYIAKPIHDMAVLEHAVNKSLERANLLKENHRYREHLEEEVKKRTFELEQRTQELQELSDSLKNEIIKCERAEEAVRKVNKELKTLSDCNHAVVRATDEDALIQEMCRILVDVGGYVLAWVGLLDNTNVNRVHPITCSGCDEKFADFKSFLITDKGHGQDTAVKALQTRQPQLSRHDGPSNALIKSHWVPGADGCRSAIALPLVFHEELVGVLNIYAKDPEAFDREDKLLLELADDLAYGIISIRSRVEREEMSGELKASVKKLRSALEGTVQVVASTVEVRDPYTAGHQRRVALLARAIAEDLGLSDNIVNGVFMAGVVHDLGKIYVPAEILSKPNRLNDIEFSLIKTHPQVGYDLLRTIEFPWPIAQIVHQHHERIDGKGYPQGLHGDEILLEAKIICVADVVEAMASHRPYRPSRGMERALGEIEKNKGALYDPDVVDSCMKLFKEDGFTFE